MGRNTANRVSNAVFGDKWSTPYRVGVNDGRSSRQEKPSRSKNTRNAPVAHNRKSHNSRGNKKKKKNGLSAKGWITLIYAIVLLSVTFRAFQGENVLPYVIIGWVIAIAYLAWVRFRP